MANITERDKIIKQLKIMLGGDLTDVDLSKDAFDLCIDLALDRYRQMSSNAVEESYVFFTILQGTNEYVLPDEIVEVRQIFRRQFGVASAGADGQYDPFDLAYTNLYILQAGSLGGLATYDLYQQQVEIAGRMFGYHYNFTWDSTSRKIKIMRNPRSEREEVLLWVYNVIPEEKLLRNEYAKSWLRSWALAEAKMLLGQSYEKFASLGGPQGGVVLNGAQLKSESQLEKDTLLDQVKKWGDARESLGFVFD